MKRIKGFSAFLFLAVAPLAFSAKPTLICPFKDTFNLDVISPGRIINTPFTTGNLAYMQESDTTFALSCASNVNYSAGDLYVDVGFDQGNKCTLTIHDGPLVMNPAVSYVNCIGNINYAGMSHVDGKYEYTLNFNF